LGNYIWTFNNQTIARNKITNLVGSSSATTSFVMPIMPIVIEENAFFLAEMLPHNAINQLFLLTPKAIKGNVYPMQ